MIGEMLTIWTARLAFVAYLGRYAAEATLQRCRSPGAKQWLRCFWTAGCVLLWAHVGCAFSFVHGWSNAAAVGSTARQTQAVTGIDSGFGVYLNYLLMVLWAGDVLWWWISPRTFATRSAIADRLWQGFLAFIWFNATVVFAAGPVRWIGVAATLAALGMLVCARTVPQATSEE